MDFKHILYQRDGAVVTVTINRPERRNALNLDTVKEMMSALERVGAEPDVRVLVITGAGDAFCSGADLKDAPEMDHRLAHEVVRLYLDYVAAVRSVEIPVIARINGDAIGGGCCTALACDIRVAADARRQVALLLVGGAEGGDGREGQEDVHVYAQEDARRGVGQFLGHDGRGDGVAVAAAVGRGELDPQVAQLAELLEDVQGELFPLVALPGDGSHLLLGEGTDRPAEHLLLLAEGELHP